jgi:hypothetical protein
MKRRPHVIVFVLFVLFLLYDIVVWGALPLVPDVGESIVDSANREAPLAATYILLGRSLDGAIPALQAFGESQVVAAFGEGFARIREDSTVAMDLIFSSTWNFEHRWMKTVYWFPPLLLVVGLVFWWRRPRQISTIRGRR